MSRIAVLSDIHGNIRALEPVLADIEARAIPTIVNLGDCAYGPFDPTSVLDRLMLMGAQTVSGNEDRILVEAAAGKAASQTAQFCASLLDSAQIDWLQDLPLSAHVGDAQIFHGTPTDDTQYLLTAADVDGVHLRSSGEIDHLIPDAQLQLIFCGHDHTPRVVTLPSGRVVVNPGSVGCQAYADDVPCDHIIEMGSPHARYAIVEQSEHGPKVELVCVIYDWQAAAREAMGNGFPHWARWLATGRA